MKYCIRDDLILIRTMLSISQQEMANTIGVDKKTIIRIENGDTYPLEENIEKLYNLAYKKGIKINSIKEMLYKEEYPHSKIIFHGSKKEIEGEISPLMGRSLNDFGNGFYCGESYEQTTSFIVKFPESSMYIIEFKDNRLKHETFNVDQEWMLAIAYFRGKLDKYKNHKLIESIVNKVKESDYIVAPIADNRMFRIIDRFIDGEITDEQCKHCLAATNLGNQYVFLTKKATAKLKILEKCYISKGERLFFMHQKDDELQDSDNKVKFAMIKYKNKGKYIEEILK